MTFGSQLWGADDAQIEQWQRLYKATTGGRQGKSKTLFLLLAKDPTAKAATGPIRTLADMLWDAAMRTKTAQYECLRQAWETMQKWDTKTPWKRVRGPAAAAAASLHRIGWKAGDFPELIDEENRSHSVLGIGPKALGTLLDQAWHRRLRRHAATKLGLPQGQEVDLHHARQIIKAGRIQEGQDEDLLQPDEGRAEGHKAECRCPLCVDPVKLQEAKQKQRRLTATARNFVTGGIWDKPRLRTGGYDVPEDEMKCDPCEEPDSLEHRLWVCQGTEELRHKLLTVEELAWMDEDRECEGLEKVRKRLAKKGLCRHPGIGQPHPAKEGWTVAGNTAELLLSHRVAIDGHCSKEFHPALNRASWSVVGWQPGSEEELHVAGPVWDGMPQTSAAAERVAMMVAHQVTEQNQQHLGKHTVNVIVDNTGAMNMVAKPAQWDKLKHSHYAGLQRELRATAAYRDGAVTVTHCMSHQDKKLTVEQLNNQSDELKHDRAANDLADEVCNKASEQHPKRDHDMYKKDKWAHAVAGKVLKYAAQALDLYPQNVRHQRRATVADRRARQSVTIAHTWVELPMQKAMGWRCSTCWRWAAKKDSATTQCKGPPVHFREIAEVAKRAGHQPIHLVPKGGSNMPSVAICTTCAAIATQGSNCYSGLRGVCGRGATNNKNAASILKRAWKGIYPRRGRFGDGVWYDTPTLQ